MSYIGRGIDQIDNISTLDNLSFNGSDATFNLTQNSVAFVPVSADALQIQIDGVIQSGNYTVSGSTVTFDFVPSGSSVCNGIKHFGVGLLTQPSTGSVGINELSASGTKDATTFLRGDNTFSTVSGTTINNNADNRVITGSGTANTLEGEANLTFDGNTLTANKVILTNSSGLTGGASSDGFITNADDTDTGIVFPDSDRIQFWTGDVERMRLRSNGYLGVTGTAGTGIERRLSVYGSHVSEDGLVWIQTSNGSGDDNLVLFFDGNTNNCGEITLNASANTVAYVTSSDYRLKQNATNISDGITRLKQLKPYRFQWKSDPDNTVDGFFAHEAQEIVPEAVTGTKDAMKTAENVVVNEDGSVECYNIAEADWEQGKLDGKYASNSTWEATKEVIDRQGIDQAKLVPLLTAALKEAITKIETLEARVQALENA